MTYNLRVFFIGGYLSYRALFNWMYWSYYIPTMLGAPLFQILFFAYIGRFAQVESDEFFVVGNAVLLSSMAGIYGMAMTVGGERWTATLGSLMASPANRLPLFLGRCLPLIVNGVITSAFGFAVGWLLLDFTMPADRIPALAVVVFVSAFSCTALGLVIGALGLRARDVFFLANLVVYLLVSDLVWTELGIGVAYATLGTGSSSSSRARAAAAPRSRRSRAAPPRWLERLA